MSKSKELSKARAEYEAAQKAVEKAAIEHSEKYHAYLDRMSSEIAAETMAAIAKEDDQSLAADVVWKVFAELLKDTRDNHWQYCLLSSAFQGGGYILWPVPEDVDFGYYLPAMEELADDMKAKAIELKDRHAKELAGRRTKAA